MMTVEYLFSLLKHLIWPRHCPVCGRVGTSCCQKCLESLVNPFPLFSIQKNSFRKYEPGSSVPDGCCFALTEYIDISRTLILNLKYRNCCELGPRMGRLMAENAPHVKADIIIPVPLHKGSERNYNQTLLIAEGISGVTGIPVADIAEWQHKMPSKASMKHVHRSKFLPDNMFDINGDISGKRVILVDDVYTTGGTLSALAHTVESKGAVVALGMVWGKRLLADIETSYSDINIFKDSWC